MRRALAGGRYSVVPADRATYELSADLVQVGTDTSFKLRLIDARTARVAIDRDGRCTGCDDLEAASRLQLAVESLLVTALEAPARPSSDVGEAGRTRLPASAWTRALPWVGLLGVAGASAAVNAHYRCRESDGSADACTVPLIGLTSVAVLSAGMAVGASLSLGLGDSSGGERAPPPRWAPWVILLSGAAAGASGIAILTEHGYGNNDVKALGYASTGAGALVVATAVGAIINSAPAGRGQMALSVAPASVALSAHF